MLREDFIDEVEEECRSASVDVKEESRPGGARCSNNGTNS
jgi:hypothetical protein